MKNHPEGWDVPLGTKKEKPWGYERPLGEFQGIFLKELFLKQGRPSSLHYHEKKDELFYLVDGHIKVIIKDQEQELTPGQTLHIPPKTVHRIIPLKDSLILEMGTRMFGDVIRVEDKYQRPARE